MPEQEIKAGDRVVIKSSNALAHKMTVGGVDGEHAICYYWTTGPELVWKKVPIKILERY
jgi:hypothetical protein